MQTRLRLGHDREALESAAKWREIFGPENYFLELMDHGLAIERRVREGLLEIGRKLGIPPLATNDCHYVTRDAAHNHEALLCVQTGKTLSDPTRFKFDGDGYYLKSAAEMRAIWDDQVPGACDSTLLIAERVQSYADVWAPRDRMPVFPVPEGHDQASLAAPRGRPPGCERRFPGGVPAGLHRPRRLRDRGHLRQGLPVLLPDRRRPDQLRPVGRHPGRPRPWFGRRFAGGLRDGHHQHRPDPARAAVRAVPQPRARRRCPTSTSTSTTVAAARWCATPPNKWGSDRVAQVITFGTIKTKAALKDSARVHYGQPGFAIADRITKALPPPIMAKDIPLSGITDPTHERYKEAAEVRGADRHRSRRARPSTRPRAGWRAWSATPACTPAR